MIRAVRAPLPKRFQFTHPGRGATERVNLFVADKSFQFTHPGRGATSFTSLVDFACKKFQFTHPSRGATREDEQAIYEALVSIHAPREGCDSPIDGRRGSRSRFNSRTPGGVRQSTTIRK